MKKIISLFIAVVIMTAMLPITASVSAAGTEYATFPKKSEIRITQGVNETYSHKGRKALDVATSGDRNVYAPFTGVIKKKYTTDSNVVWLESSNPVQYADGTVDYMTMMVMHDNNISDLWVGQTISQGTAFYQEGTAGGVTGTHVHIEFGRGKFSGTGWYQNSYGKWCINNGIDPWNAVYLPTGIKRTNDYGYNWRTVSIPPVITSVIIPSGTYKIRHQNSGKLLSASLSTNVQQTYIWADEDHLDQKFDIALSKTENGNYWYSIKSKYSGYCLDVRGGGNRDCTPVDQYPFYNTNNQLWRFVDCGGGYYKIIGKESGLCIDINGNGTGNGTPAQICYDNGTTAQRFALVPVSDQTLTLKDYNYPTTINAGKPFTIYGTITSPVKIKRVLVGVSDARGDNWPTYRNVYPNSTTFDIKDVDPYILFNKVPRGTWYYSIYVELEDGTTKWLLDQQFTVV